VWLLCVHVRSLCSLLLTAHCSVLPRLKRLQNYESCLASMYWLQFSLFIICPIIQWVVISPMLCDGTVWNHTFLEPCFNENRDQFVKTGSGQT